MGRRIAPYTQTYRNRTYTSYRMLNDHKYVQRFWLISNDRKNVGLINSLLKFICQNCEKSCQVTVLGSAVNSKLSKGLRRGPRLSSLSN